jgi:hypothetical protein
MSSPPDHSYPEALEPPTHARKTQRHRPDEAEKTGEVTVPRPLDPDQDLPGAVFMVPNRHWGFESHSSEDHPGVCAHYPPQGRDAILVKGTDAEHIRVPRRYYVVAPTEGNGLQKPTAFELVPRYFRLHRLRLFYPERYLGRIEVATLHALCEELARACDRG